MRDTANPAAMARAGFLAMYTITKNPSDYPDKYVVRLSTVPRSNRNFVAVCDTQEQARAKVPCGLICFPRDVSDDPVIVETWL